MKEIALIIIFTYLIIATIIYFNENLKDGRSFVIHLIIFSIAGAIMLILPIIPLLILFLIPNEYIQITRGIILAYLLLLIFFGIKYLIKEFSNSDVGKFSNNPSKSEEQNKFIDRNELTTSVKEVIRNTTNIASNSLSELDNNKLRK